MKCTAALRLDLHIQQLLCSSICNPQNTEARSARLRKGMRQNKNGAYAPHTLRIQNGSDNPSIQVKIIDVKQCVN